MVILKIEIASLDQDKNKVTISIRNERDSETVEEVEIAIDIQKCVQEHLATRFKPDNLIIPRNDKGEISYN